MAPQYSLSRNPRTSAFFKREKQPYTAPQEALMMGTQSPGPQYLPLENTIQSTKETPFAYTFGVSGTERHSYLPSEAKGRRPGGLADTQEEAFRKTKARAGTEAVQKVRSCLGSHYQSKDRTTESFSFGNSRRNHFADSRGNHVDGASIGIGNRRAVSQYSAKWA